ncbi:MAG: hypothetical protein WC397_00355 [Candidatus Paceibacterota bacterium]|jgi:hypothetical protein
MDVVYYYDEKSSSCPVREYLNQYSKDTKLIIDIRQRIKVVKERDGRPTPPLTKPLRGYSFYEFRHRYSAKNALIRILYFCYKDKIVLLNVFEKPDHYETNFVRKKIKKHYDITETYFQKFLSNPKLYEEYKE